jgi:hypothetical protein
VVVVVLGVVLACFELLAFGLLIFVACASVFGAFAVDGFETVGFFPVSALAFAPAGAVFMPLFFACPFPLPWASA